MPVNSIIKDGGGSKRSVKVTPDQALLSTILVDPPFIPQKSRPFSQLLTQDGTASGTSDMGVDGSSTNVDYYIQAAADEDIYLKALSFEVGYGGSATLYQFADATALTNGFRIFYESIKGEQDLSSSIKTNSDLIRLAVSDILPTSWEVRNLGSLNDYGYIVTVDLLKYSPGQGIKLDKGTSQRFTIRIRDDAQNADTFNCLVSGFKRFEL